MYGTGAVTLYTSPVEPGRVSFVTVEMVLWIHVVVFIHDRIPSYLGEDRSRGDRNTEGVTFYERSLWYDNVGEGQGIDQYDRRFQ